MNQHSESLRLAEAIEQSSNLVKTCNKEAAKELRRLHEVNKALYEAAQTIVERWDSPLHKFDALTGDAINDLKAALAKARGEG